MKVVFFFRSKDLHAFSVEKLFSSIIPLIKNNSDIAEVHMPCYRVSLRSILQNILFACKISRKTDRRTIFHITGDVYYISLGLPRSRTVLTVLDTVSLTQNKGIKRFLIKLIWFTIPIRRCKYITVISDKTKNEIISLYPDCKEKITVIPCPVDDKFTKSLNSFNEKKPVILQVGTKENKNLRRVIEAIEGIQCEFHIVGKLSQDEIDLLHSKKINYVNKVQISDNEILSEYQNCDILVFASTYEGFGMPIIEAQASGKSVVTSNIEPMISVSGRAAHLVDPFSVSDIRKAIIDVVEDREKREILIARGLENANNYRSCIIADKYNEMYMKVNNDLQENMEDVL